MANVRVSAISALPWLIAMAGCFSSGGDGGVSSAAAVNTLDPAEARALCDELIPPIRAGGETGLCVAVAAREIPDDPAACRALAARCQERLGSDLGCGDITFEHLATCPQDVTVGDYRSCTREVIEWFEGASCEMPPPPMPSCSDALSDACPGPDASFEADPANADLDLAGSPCELGASSTQACPATAMTMCGMAGGTVTRVCHPAGAVPTLAPPAVPGTGVWSACCCAQNGVLFCGQ